MTISNSIAIVGVGGIFPDSPTLQQFWHNIQNKVNTSMEVPKGRWPVDTNEVYSNQKGEPDKVYSKRACFINDFELNTQGLDIDQDFVSRLDPLFHIALHAGRDAYMDCNNSNIDKARAKIIIGNIVLPSQESSKLAMDYLGKSFDEHIAKLTNSKPNLNKNQADPVARFVAGLPGGVLAKALGFGGGSYTLDAACASSLYAISLAIDELLAGRTDAVLAGGVSRPDCFYTQMGFSQLHALSPNGISAPFDKDSNGLVVGEGAGMFMLKRLQDAIDANDYIYGCIKGVGLSNDVDGSLLAPSSEGQLRAMRQAYAIAGWSPNDIDLIECHATGTPVGDAVEFQSLEKLWGEKGWQRSQCVIGSVKSNIGHLLTAAGGAALMKVVLALKNKVLPPTANFKTPRSDIDFSRSPFKLLTEAVKWEQRDSVTPRRAGISAFGFGGINAHLLIEEWMPETVMEEGFEHVELQSDNQIEVAITGMETHFGNWKNLGEFRDRVLGGYESDKPFANSNWWGGQGSDWFEHFSSKNNSFKGFYINDLSIPLNKFRIPPKELDEILPQQLLMLEVVEGAITDGRLSEEEKLNTSVIIGIGLDLNTTNFHLRWMMREKAKEIVKNLGLTLDALEFEKLVTELMEITGPALSANRTLGALGGVVASRVAREFRLGGPSFTVSNEECSGLRAVETAVRLLQTKKIKQAVVGAIDMAGDIRSVLSTDFNRQYSKLGLACPFDQDGDGTIPADGAAAIILKPLNVAIKAEDKIYGVIRGVGSTTGGDLINHIPSKNGYKSALENAYNEAGVTINNIGLLETNGSGLPSEDKMEIESLLEMADSKANNVDADKTVAISSVKADIGHSGAAAGLASLVKAALCLYYQRIPAIRNFKKIQNEFVDIEKSFYLPTSPSYWLRNRDEGPRRAGVSSFSMDGNCTHFVVEEFKDGLIDDDKSERLLFSRCSEGLFVIKADGTFELKSNIKHLQEHIQKYANQSIQTIAKLWWQQESGIPQNKPVLTIVASNFTELNTLLEKVYEDLSDNNSFENLKNIDENRVFFSLEPLSDKGEIAFVYPGSGNHYSGMGRELVMQWPDVVRQEEELSGYLMTQFAPQLFWTNKTNEEINNDKRGVLLAQVSIGCFITDLLNSFGIKPQAAIGYSLGESTSLLSLKVWGDRDEMMRRIMKSDLFVNDLAGRYNTARKEWSLADDEDAKWVVGLVLCSEEVVREVVGKSDRAYLLIVNTPKECVIGGDADYVKDVVDKLGCKYFPLDGVTIAHCKILQHVADDYRNFHMFDVTLPDGIRFYSGAWGKSYEMSSEKAADSVTSHALRGFHFPHLIQNAYKDGVRIFVEIGPGASCCRMIDKILGDLPHAAMHVINSKQNEVSSTLKLLAQLISQGVEVDLGFLYGNGKTALPTDRVEMTDEESVTIPVGGKPFKPIHFLDSYLRKKENRVVSHDVVASNVVQDKFASEGDDKWENERANESLDEKKHEELVLNLIKGHESVIKSIRQSSEAKSNAHGSFLSFSNNITQTMTKNLEFQLSLIESMGQGDSSGIDLNERFEADINVNLNSFETSNHDVIVDDNKEIKNVAFDREQCMEFAVGKIGNVLGERYAEIDAYPTRVRLPDEPMMFVDRILMVEGEPCSLKSGRVVTEHDIVENAWYLDCNRIPTCVAVEAGQADLFLSGYLGIDFKSKGLAVYRLLDAVVTFYMELPQPGEVIKYDIHIEHFFKHGKTYLFRFNFEATVNGEPLLSMKDGCAGFFTARELDEGKGIIEQDTDDISGNGRKPKSIPEIVPMEIEAYTESQLKELRSGNLVGCFGDLFEGVNLRKASVIPGDMMKLVHRITRIEPKGGQFGLGFVRGEADIHKDDWFLVCHFVDDKVMPGTLMYECCMHTLRVYLLRMGWIGEEDEAVYQPVPGVASRLKCRGQVLKTTKLVTYEISIKELGYRPEPYVICDALMYADEKAIVKIDDMSLRISGLTEEKIKSIWDKSGQHNMKHTAEKREAIFNTDRILDFAIGKPSEAFGKPYEIFDDQRKIGRLPGPPYKFLDRIVEINAEPWKMKSGGTIEAEYDIPTDVWYFKENCQEIMPFSILLEIALQPCGWLAAYVGSALTSEIDLSFRNLGGKAVIRKPVYCDTGTLVTTVTMTRVSQSGGMIIQHYDFHVKNNNETVYIGDTYFGFFTKDALAEQIGIRDAKVYKPNEQEIASGRQFDYPVEPPYPTKMMRMLDRIVLFIDDGGTNKLGFIRGEKDVNPDEWFFKAHFYQDPVCPGSLGLESFLQLLKVVAINRWGVDEAKHMEAIPVNEEHSWVYRGQVIPADKKVTVEAVVSEIDDEQRLIKADGFLSVDGRVIYEMKDFTARVWGNNR